MMGKSNFKSKRVHALARAEDKTHVLKNQNNSMEQICQRLFNIKTLQQFNHWWLLCSNSATMTAFLPFKNVY